MWHLLNLTHIPMPIQRHLLILRSFKYYTIFEFQFQILVAYVTSVASILFLLSLRIPTHQTWIAHLLLCCQFRSIKLSLLPIQNLRPRYTGFKYFLMALPVRHHTVIYSITSFLECLDRIYVLTQEIIVQSLLLGKPRLILHLEFSCLLTGLQLTRK